MGRRCTGHQEETIAAVGLAELAGRMTGSA
jgi:hypothetical protein